MKVEIAYADNVVEAIVGVEVADAACVREAVTQSGLLARVAMPHDELAYAIYGRRVDADALLRPGDRVEITRPLSRDAKAARRARAARK